jgi:excisionase family DNA binding protein
LMPAIGKEIRSMCEMLSTEQAAEYCGVSPRTLEKHRSRGGGPVFVKLGGLVRYKVEDLEAWIAGGRRRSTSDPGAPPASL